MSKRKDEIERELKSYSSSSYNDLHENLLIKIEEAMEEEGIPDKTTLALAWMRDMIDSLYNIDHVDARKAFLAGKKSGVQIASHGFKRIGEMVFFEYRPSGKSIEKLDYWIDFRWSSLLTFMMMGLVESICTIFQSRTEKNYSFNL